jgi:D-tyrosyl-tRNA(Tyr) deacylase
MRVLLQRVTRAGVRVEGEEIASIGPGLLLFLGVTHGDARADADWLAEKVAALRVFGDETGKMNRSALDIGGQALVVSQFTLYGDCRKGRRPGFDGAAPPDLANELYEYFLDQLRAQGLTVASGRFAAHMEVSLVNDGPVTFILDSPEK